MKDVEAVVLRTLRYGEADLIAHVLTRHFGRRGVIAKGARRSKSRLGVRLEPLLSVRMQLHEGRGELAIVRGVEVVDSCDALRASWQAQEVAADAVGLVMRTTIEHDPIEPAYHLLTNFLRRLEQMASTKNAGGAHAMSIRVAFELKLLHVLGFAPCLDACVRCGDQGSLTGFSSADGGTVCHSCRQAADFNLDVETLRVVGMLMSDSLAAISSYEVSNVPTKKQLDMLSTKIVAALCREHTALSRQ